MTIPVPAGLKPLGSVRFAPPRRPGSVRRTATIDFTWPDGMAGNTVLDGRARDMRTDGDGTATILDEATLCVVSDSGRVIKEIQSAPSLAGLPGESAMSGFRRRLAGVTGDGEPAAGTAVRFSRPSGGGRRRRPVGRAGWNGTWQDPRGRPLPVRPGQFSLAIDFGHSRARYVPV